MKYKKDIIYCAALIIIFHVSIYSLGEIQFDYRHMHFHLADESAFNHDETPYGCKEWKFDVSVKYT